MPDVVIKGANYRGEALDVLLHGGRAVPARRGAIPADTQVIEAAGLTLLPAFSDYHVHFREPGQTEKEDLLSGSRAAAAGGYVCVCCEPNTVPVIDCVAAVEAFYHRASELRIPLDLHTKIALTKGQAGEELVAWDPTVQPGPISKSSDGEPMTDFETLVRALRASYLPVDLHCEETAASHDRVVAALGSGEPYAREPELVALALRALKAAGRGRLHIQHVSMARTVSLLEEAHTEGLHVTAEATPHHLTLCAEDVPLREWGRDANWKMNPPLRSREDMMAVRRGLAEGTIEAIASDHAPHTPVEKARRWDDAPFGVIGLETTFAVCHSLVLSGELPFARLVDAMGCHYGVLHPAGKLDGIVLVDRERKWTVDPERCYSKGRNCPFAGQELVGKAIYTLVSHSADEGGEWEILAADGVVMF